MSARRERRRARERRERAPAPEPLPSTNRQHDVTQQRDHVPGRHAVYWLLASALTLGALGVVSRWVTLAWPGGGGAQPSAEQSALGQTFPHAAALPSEQAEPPFVPDVHRTSPDSALARQLDSYGWVDRARGVVSVPVSQAMEWMVTLGLRPEADEGATNPPTPADGGARPREGGG